MVSCSLGARLEAPAQTWLEEVSQKVVGGFVLLEIARRLQVSA